MLFSLLPLLKAQESFKDVGNIYHYKYIGRDYFIVYISGDNSYETLISRSTRYPVWNKYIWNWSYLMVEQSSWEYTGPLESAQPVMTIRAKGVADFSKKEYRAEGEDKTEKGIERFSAKARFSRTPTVNYNLDEGFSLGWIINAYKNELIKNNKIKIGLIAGWYYVNAEISYKGEEAVSVPYGDIQCYKFEVKGEGLLATLYGKKAWMWLSKEDPSYVVRYRNEMPRNGLESGIDFQLSSITKNAKADDWEMLRNNYTRN